MTFPKTNIATRLFGKFSKAVQIVNFNLRYKRIQSVEMFLQSNKVPDNLRLAIDLGCGDHPQNLFRCKEIIGLDIRNPNELLNIKVMDLFNDPLPIESSSASIVTALDFIEHVPRYGQVDNKTRFPFVILMNEIYRALEPGGYFFSRTPAYPAPKVFQDPTHVNFITEETFPVYFCNHMHEGMMERPLGRYYGFAGAFKLIDQKWCHHWLLTLMQKPL